MSYLSGFSNIFNTSRTLKVIIFKMSLLTFKQSFKCNQKIRAK